MDTKLTLKLDKHIIESAKKYASEKKISLSKIIETEHATVVNGVSDDIQKDINVLFPIDRLRELIEAKVIGKLASNFYSFGFGGNMTEEYIGESDGSAHQLAQELIADEVDYVIMVPA